MKDAIPRLVRGELRDPHSLLGRHPSPDGGTIVRAWRPEADSVTVNVKGDAVGKLDKLALKRM